MTLATSHIDLFRNEWAERFVDACTIDRTTDRGPLNQGTLQYDSPTISNIYAGPCLVRPMARSGSPDYGQEQIARKAYEVMLPFNANGIEPQDRITITASVKETALVGAVLTAFYEQKDSWNTHRLIVAELNEGGGNP